MIKYWKLKYQETEYYNINVNTRLDTKNIDEKIMTEEKIILASLGNWSGKKSREKQKKYLDELHQQTKWSNFYRCNNFDKIGIHLRNPIKNTKPGWETKPDRQIKEVKIPKNIRDWKDRKS